MTEKNREGNIIEEEGITIFEIFDNELKRKGLNPKKIFDKSLPNYERLKEMFLGEFSIYTQLEIMKSKETKGWFKHDELNQWNNLYKNKKLFLNKPQELVINEIQQSTLVGNIARFFWKGKRFKMEPEINELFNLTNNKIYFRNNPFYSYIIEANIQTIKDVEVLGIIITEGYYIKKKEKGIYYFIFGIDWRDKSTFYIRGSISENLSLNSLGDKQDTNAFPKEELNIIEKKCLNYICNFLDFLNHPNVETRIIKDSQYNPERIKKGKFPFQDKIIINLKGNLNRYIYEEIPQIKNKNPSFAFWVRGHYVHFWDKNKYCKLYSLKGEQQKERGLQINEKGIIRKWILPYIKYKEKGKPKERIYKISKINKINGDINEKNNE